MLKHVRDFPDGLAAPGQHFVDFHEDNVDEDNPRGVGDTFGELEKPYGSSWQVRYADGEVLTVDCTKLKKPPQVGHVMEINGKAHELSWYDEVGSHWVPVEDGNDAQQKKNKPAGDGSTDKQAGAKATKEKPKTKGRGKGDGSTDKPAGAKTIKEKPKTKGRGKGDGNTDKPAGAKTTKKKKGRGKGDGSTEKPAGAKTTKKKKGRGKGDGITDKPAGAKTTKKKKARGKGDGSTEKPAAAKKKRVRRRSPNNTKTSTKSAKKLAKAAKAKGTPGAKWLRDPVRTPLRAGPAAKLSKALSGMKDGLKGIFAERVMKMYVREQKSALHLHYKKVLQYSVTQVFQQVRPPEEKPYGGDAQVAVEELKGIAIKVFDIRYT